MSTNPLEQYVPEWTVGDRLRRIRRDAGLSVIDFAGRLSLGHQRYSAWETGRNQPPIQEFVGIAKRIELAFGVPAEWTLGLEVRNTPGPDGTEGDTSPRQESNPRHSHYNVDGSDSTVLAFPAKQLMPAERQRRAA